VMLSHMLMDSARCSSNGRNVRPDILSVFQPPAGGLQTPAISPALAKPGGSAGVRTSGAVRLVRALSWARARHGDQQQWRADPKHRLPAERLGQLSTRTGPAVVVNAYAALASIGRAAANSGAAASQAVCRQHICSSFGEFGALFLTRVGTSSAEGGSPDLDPFRGSGCGAKLICNRSAHLARTVRFLAP